MIIIIIVITSGVGVQLAQFSKCIVVMAIYADVRDIYM